MLCCPSIRARLVPTGDGDEFCVAGEMHRAGNFRGNIRCAEDTPADGAV